MNPPEIPSMPLSYQSREVPLISKNRRMAGRILMVLGILGIVAGLSCGGLSIFMGVRAAPATDNLMFLVIGVVYFILGEGAGITYVICSRKIRSGGYASVIVALILGSVHELCLLMAFVGMAMMFVLRPRTSDLGPIIISAVIELFVAAAVAQLLYYLIRILREPRGKLE